MIARCPQCARDADFVETFQGARSCYHPFHTRPEPIALCAACFHSIGGAHGGPDAPYRLKDEAEFCQAADCISRPL